MQEITRQAIRQFAEITDDFSPVHLDHDYALSLGLKDNFAHGLLGASWAVGFVSARSAEMPVGAEFNFGIPVFCGDSLGVEPVEELLTNRVSFNVINSEGLKSSSGVLDLLPPGEFLPVADSVNQATTDFIPVSDKVYFAEDMYRDGPRGFCPPIQLTAEEVDAYIEFSGENSALYSASEASEIRTVPPMLVFCRAFSGWLKAFTCVKTPDDGFPGHLKDSWVQHRSVRVGDTLNVYHQVATFRESQSKPGMALIGIDIRVYRQREQLVQSATVLLMMATGLPPE